MGRWDKHKKMQGRPGKSGAEKQSTRSIQRWHVPAFSTVEESGTLLWKGRLEIKGDEKILCRELPKKGKEAREQWACWKNGKQHILARTSIWGLVTDNSNSMLELGHAECLNARQRDPDFIWQTEENHWRQDAEWHRGKNPGLGMRKPWVMGEGGTPICRGDSDSLGPCLICFSLAMHWTRQSLKSPYGLRKNSSPGGGLCFRKTNPALVPPEAAAWGPGRRLLWH